MVVYVTVYTRTLSLCHALCHPLGSHRHFDDQFPGVCFLGNAMSQEIPVQSETVTITPPGLGVSLKIPPGAVRSDTDKPVNITVQACLSGSTFKYPEGCTPLSAVYHISADSSLEKEIDLTLEHFAQLETEMDTSEMTFFRAESIPTVTDGEEEFIFTKMEGGKFAVNGNHCTISTQTFSLIFAGTKGANKIRKPINYTDSVCVYSFMHIYTHSLGKRYAVLCSYSNEVRDVAYAAIAVSLDDPVYITV